MRKQLRCSSISDLVMYFSTLLSFSISAPPHFTHSYLTKESVPKFAFRHTLKNSINFNDERGVFIQ